MQPFHMRYNKQNGREYLMAYTEMLDRQKHKLKSHKFVQTPDFPKSHKFLTCIQLYNTGQYEDFIMQYKPSNILRVFPLGREKT